MQHAASTELRLEHRDSGTARELRLQGHAIEAILSAAPEVELKVRLWGQHATGRHNAAGMASLWSGSTWWQVKQLTLYLFPLTADMLQNQLQLQQCTQLHTLVVSNSCDSFLSQQQLAVLARQRTSIFPPTLQTLQVNSYRDGAIADMIHILGPQLTHLGCIRILAHYPMGKLNQLTHISLDTLGDTAMEHLMALPHLMHVETQCVQLKQSYVSKQLQWHQLKVFDGPYLEDLLPLPLHHIRQLVFQGGIFCEDSGRLQQVTAHLASSPNLQCVPTTKGYHLPGCPQFVIEAEQLDKLVSLCANNMTASGGLYLNTTAFTAIQGLLSCVSTLPPKVSMLCINSPRTGLQQVAIEQRVQVLQQLVGALPQHVKHFVIAHDNMRTHDICAYATGIIRHLDNNQKATKLVVAVHPTRGISPELQALAHAHPGHLSCVRMEYGPY